MRIGDCWFYSKRDHIHMSLEITSLVYFYFCLSLVSLKGICSGPHEFAYSIDKRNEFIESKSALFLRKSMLALSISEWFQILQQKSIEWCHPIQQERWRDFHRYHSHSNPTITPTSFRIRRPFPLFLHYFERGIRTVPLYFYIIFLLIFFFFNYISNTIACFFLSL